MDPQNWFLTLLSGSACRAGVAAIEIFTNTFDVQWSTQLSQMTVDGVVDTSGGIKAVTRGGGGRVPVAPDTVVDFVYAFAHETRKVDLKVQEHGIRRW